MTNAPTTRETADHAELADQARRDLEWSCLTTIRPTALLALLSEIAALRGEHKLTLQDGSEAWCSDAAWRWFQEWAVRLEQAERQRDELRKAADTAASLFKLCTEPTMFENASTLNVYAQMTEWLVRNRPLIANQGADQ